MWQNLKAFCKMCVACELCNAKHQYVVTSTTMFCASAGLQNVQDLRLCGQVAFAEEKQGILNTVLEGVTSLHLAGSDMRCSDIASPSLRYLTALLHTRRLPGADGFSRRLLKVNPGPSPAS